jgi:hypothetical protein
MIKQQSDIDKYLQWKYETIAGMTKQEFAEFFKQQTGTR